MIKSTNIFFPHIERKCYFICQLALPATKVSPKYDYISQNARKNFFLKKKIAKGSNTSSSKSKLETLFVGCHKLPTVELCP